MDLKLRDKSVLVTGASRGIGQQLAYGFAEEGARVAICGRNLDQLEAVATEIRRRDAECIALRADLSLPGDCLRVVDDAAITFGRLDILVNNASTNVDETPASLQDASDAQVMARFLGKTMAAIRCSRAAVPHMKLIGGGRIICIGGTSARTVFRNGELGSSSSALPQGLGNAALANFSKFLSEELARDKITVNIVHPHLTRSGRHEVRLKRRAIELGTSESEAELSMTRHIPIGRMIEPHEIVPMVLLLSSSLSAGVTGQAIAIDGGAVKSVSY